MRTTGVFVIAALALAGCYEPPVVEIVSPASGSLVTDRAPISFDVRVTGDDLVEVGLLLDGQPVTAAVEPPLAGLDCGAGCAARLTWSGLEASEGSHTLTVFAEDRHELGEASIQMAFEDEPSLSLVTPSAPDQLGVGHLDVTATVQDRGAIAATVTIDGVVVPGTEVLGDCRFGCQVRYPWDTAALLGEHLVEVAVSDALGHTASTSRTVVFDDLPFVTAIEITNTTDTGGFSDLDIEVHLLDAATDAWLGCAGQLSGLEDVDDSNVHYEVFATFVDGGGATLGLSDLAGRDILFHVMEDDTLPCPENTDLATDDIVGTSPPVAAEDIAAAGPMAFGDVVHLQVGAGRPYRR